MWYSYANTTDERVADARKIKSWLETSGRMTLTAQSTPSPGSSAASNGYENKGPRTGRFNLFHEWQSPYCLFLLSQ